MKKRIKERYIYTSRLNLVVLPVVLDNIIVLLFDETLS